MNNFSKWYSRFLKTGDPQPLQFGMTRDQIRSLFGEPHDIGGTSKKQRLPLILKYNDLEFHFGPKSTDGLVRIFRD
jgi:hypothetical protein